MASVPPVVLPRRNDYPTSDGKPRAETDYHRDLMVDLIETLRDYFVQHPRVYVSGNILLFYEQGNRRKHVSPDVLVVRGVANHQRDNYLLWEEGRGPQVVIELTSSSTRSEDTKKKLALYRDVLKVREYFLFDPRGDYLKPRLQGNRLVRGEYRPVPLVEGRMPSRELDLHLEQADDALRLWCPARNGWLPTRLEATQRQTARADAEATRADAEATRAARAEEALAQLRADYERLLNDRRRANGQS